MTGLRPLLAIALGVLVLALVDLGDLAAVLGGDEDAPGSSAQPASAPATRAPSTSEPPEAQRVLRAGPALRRAPEARKDPVERLRQRTEQQAAGGTGPAGAGQGSGQGAAAEQVPVTLRLAAFNILGSNHTRPGGSAPGYEPGTTRAALASEVIERHDLDVIGFSEIQRDQLSVFLQRHGSRYAVYPGTSLGSAGVPTTVAWRSDRFELVGATSVTIPFMDQQRPMPVVRLRHLVTGRELFVMNAHNAPRDRQAERDRALALEIAMLNRLRQETGLPVFFLGDLNEKDAALCKVVDQTDLQAAWPGGNLDSCSPWRGMRLDWVFGADVDFSGYLQDTAAPVPRITDHAVVVATGTLR